jgi:hypothetical protein
MLDSDDSVAIAAGFQSNSDLTLSLLSRFLSFVRSFVRYAIFFVIVLALVDSTPRPTYHHCPSLLCSIAAAYPTHSPNLPKIAIVMLLLPLFRDEQSPIPPPGSKCIVLEGREEAFHACLGNPASKEPVVERPRNEKTCQGIPRR